MNTPSRTALFRLIFCFLLLLATASACGPDFSPDVFVRANRPDLPRQYVEGHLGLLRPSYPRADLLVAYRYLNDGTLDATEQQAWAPTYGQDEPEWMQAEQATYAAANDASNASTPLAQWVKARAAFPDAPPGPIGQQRAYKVKLTNGYEYDASFLNCADDTFRTAAATLRDRASRWGANSPYLLDWLQAQDQVLSNCGEGKNIPSSAPENSPPLLVSDRAYQTAAAHLYSMAFPEAEQEFLAISRDKASPWQPIAGYLAARTMIRQAFFAKSGIGYGEASYDTSLMQSAGQQLREYLDKSPSPAFRQAAEAQLALVRIRTEPDARAKELAVLVAGPAHDSNYSHNLRDLLWLIDKETPSGLRAQPELGEVPDKEHPGNYRPITEAEALAAADSQRAKAYEATAKLRSFAPAIDWVLTLQSLAPQAATHALAQWRSTHSTPWLVAALTLAPEDAQPPADLLAATVADSSPAWQTVAYHHARLLLIAGQFAEAREALDNDLQHLHQQPLPSSINAFRGLRMAAAPMLEDFLAYAPRTTLLVTSQEHFAVTQCQEAMKQPGRHYNCPQQVDPTQLDADAVAILNTQAPLSVWLRVAQSPALSSQIRGAVAMDGWARATLLQDSASAAAFLPLLPPDLRSQATGTALGPLMALARNPGLLPNLNAGTQRAYAYDFVESYRDNWNYGTATSAKTPVAFLTPEERREGEAQAKVLASIHYVALGQKILKQVQSSPGDPRNAEALFLVLRMIRYGCTEPASASLKQVAGTQNVETDSGTSYSEEAKELLLLKQDASRLLRQRYAASPWTRKAAPFAG